MAFIFSAFLKVRSINNHPAIMDIQGRNFSAWGDRMAEFAIYLNLITCFPNTLMPSAVYGFSTASESSSLAVIYAC